ncbi:hypothetical protein [Streptomyces sp. NPDC060333]|uniref:hypothetical protein n=1 Tax=Streptomyces sp. NPDC060333 TaxID=3347098 RepID=UPI003650C8C4
MKSSLRRTALKKFQQQYGASTYTPPPPAPVATAPAPQAPAVPLDAPSLIKGIVARIPDALAGLGEDERAVGASGAVATAVRKAVLDEFRTRAQLIGRLCEIDALLQRDGVPAVVRQTVADHLAQTGVRKVVDPTEQELFVVTDGDGPSFEVLRPAYADTVTGKLVLSGQLRRFSPEAAK